MVFLSSILLSGYLSSLLAFSFVTHPIGYCLLLLFGAFSVSGYVYLILGFSWYLVLFNLVYVGGVYILFVFVSLYNPNPFPVFGIGLELVFFSFFFLEIIFLGSGLFAIQSFSPEYSHYVCSLFEGITYCFFCLVLMLGFSVISLVGCNKDSFFR